MPIDNISYYDNFTLNINVTNTGQALDILYIDRINLIVNQLHVGLISKIVYDVEPISELVLNSSNEVSFVF